MPEGDTIFRAASRVRAAIDGKNIASVDGSNPALRAASGKLMGSQVTSVLSYGKHLIITTDSGLGIRTHMGMTGTWRVYRDGQHWNVNPGAARVVIRVAGAEAVCFSAPDIEVGRIALLEAGLTEWGPDLADPDFDMTEALRRAGELSRDRSAADLVLDQRVTAGAGNVYKSEVLFLERVHPATPLSNLNAHKVEALLSRAHRLLRLNLDRSTRITTADPRRGRELWVYGRAGKPCRRCGTHIEHDRTGLHERDTFWCPNCQPFSGGVPATGQT